MKKKKWYHWRFKKINDKNITFSVPIKKELDNGKRITYKIKFSDNFRFMSSFLPSLVHNLTEGFPNDKYTDCKSCLEYISIKNNQLIFKCLKCNKNHNTDFNKNLIKRFANTYKFCGGALINLFCD